VQPNARTLDLDAGTAAAARRDRPAEGWEAT
jgi:hypothetical protein